MKIQGLEFEKTCTACPEQYDVFLEGEQVGYVRLRWGHLTVDCPDVNGVQVYSACPVGHGEFEDNEEREHYLSEVATAINDHLSVTRDPYLQENRTEKETELLKQRSIATIHAGGYEGELNFTCDSCDLKHKCSLAYDFYNTNGDCLLGK